MTGADTTAARRQKGPVLADVRGLVGHEVRITAAGCKPTVGRIRAADHRGVTLDVGGSVVFFSWSRIRESPDPERGEAMTPPEAESSPMTLDLRPPAPDFDRIPAELPGASAMGSLEA